MDRRTWIYIARFWAFAGPAENGGLRKGDIPVGQDLPLEEGLAEGYGKINIVTCIG